MKYERTSKEGFARGNDKLVRCGFDAAITKEDGAAGDDNAPIVFAISTAASDRMRDTIAVDGWKLDNFKKNPVVLWAHDQSLPPIARATDVWIEDGKLMARAQFAPKDMPHPMGVGFGHTIGRMFRESLMNTVSVGFAPETWAFNDISGGVDFATQELLEFSPVPVPANPEALQDASRKGIDTKPFYQWCERALDTGECLVVPRARVEETYRLLKSEHGAPRGARVEIDVDEVVGLVERAKRWLTPKAEPAVNPVEQAMEELIKQLISEVKVLTEIVKAPAPVVAPEPPPVLAPPPAAPEPPSRLEQAKTLLSDPDVIQAIKNQVNAGLKAHQKEMRGEID